ncbi:MAG: cupredoxin domain-containing protein [Rhodanobacteraceae bacterium]
MKRMLLSLVLLLPLAAAAAATPEYALTIDKHVFQPGTLKIPANTRVMLTVSNNDSTPEEFESTEFNVEKIIMPKGKIKLFVGPLKAGSYHFFGEFHRDTAQGTLIVE